MWNSFLSLERPPTLGIMMAGESIDSGVAQSQADCVVISGMNRYSINAAAQAEPIKPIRATAIDFRRGSSFLF